ncbi:hypothetical protein TRFO_22983 [Tritrichomonas foetus]|uniref:Palmitoyltransferase n=1 Tax=Tritrichomonas foetus TaxID=1144522 RepID=A0A1J4KBY5_9EUKA|nr:hypothetical protein TRFO_22983 [Tritrichomonas foetus]|eukprot:OHT08474.1 hypothetical protein TRFO_22983 [Tritrichomonas foetus]
MIDEIPPHNIIVKKFPQTKIPIVYISGYPKRLFFKHWEIKLAFPFLVIFLVGLALMIYSSMTIPYVKSQSLRNFCIVELFITLIFFFWSYFSSVLMDPGFLPYDWSSTRRTKYSWIEQLEGLAINSQQIEYVETHPRPVNSCFSHSSGRLVLRPDHICGWIANWVGKRNHKNFILMMFWGSLFTLSLFWPRFLPSTTENTNYRNMNQLNSHFINNEKTNHMINNSNFSFINNNTNQDEKNINLIMNRANNKKKRDDFFAFVEDIAFIIEFFVSIGLFSGFFSQMIHLGYNQTNLQIMKNEQQIKKRIGMKESFQEVFGTGSKLLWFIPLPAFGDVIPFEIESPLDRKNCRNVTQPFIIKTFPIIDESDEL